MGTPLSFPFQTQIGVPSLGSASVGGSNDSSHQTPINSTQSSRHSEFSIYGGLDDIDLNAEGFEDCKQESVNWQWEEDEVLISAWLNVSLDSIVGIDQKGDKFWNRIHAYCMENNPNMKRGVGGIKKRWHKINQVVQVFGACHDQAYRNIMSSSNSDDIMKLAHQLYFKRSKKKFTLERHWNMLRREQKWRTQPTYSGGSKRTKIGASGMYSSSLNPETLVGGDVDVDVESPVRPQGTKKSKKKAKGKLKALEDGDEDINMFKSVTARKLSIIERHVNAKEMELADREKERACKERMIALKKKELRDKEKEKDMEIFYKDTSTMTDKQ